MKIFEAREGTIFINMDDVAYIEFTQYTDLVAGNQPEYATIVLKNDKKIIIDGHDAVAIKNFLRNKGEIII